MKIGNLNTESDSVNPVMGIELEANPIVALSKENKLRELSDGQGKLVIKLETAAKKEYEDKQIQGYPKGIEWGGDCGHKDITTAMPELRFPPAKFSTIMDSILNVEEVLRALRNNFLESNNDCSGMHIHVQRDFIKINEFYKILDFFETEQNFIATFSDRSDSRKHTFVYNQIPKGSKEHYISKENFDRGSTSHECIRLNNPSGIPTIEFRLFNGTTDLTKFIANVQFVERIVNFFKYDIKPSHKSFIEFIMESGEMYEPLIEDLTKRDLIDSKKNEDLKENIKKIIKELENA